MAKEKTIILNVKTGDSAQKVSQLTNEVIKLDNAAENTGAELANMGNKVKSNALPAMTSFSQVIQDSPYGMRGMANNIQQLTSQMGYLTASAGGLTGALKAMWVAMSGPAGILFAISIITTLMVAFESSSTKATKAVDEQAEAMKRLKAAHDDMQTILDKEIALAELQAKNTEELKRQKVLANIQRKKDLEDAIVLMEIALQADHAAARELSFWDKWFGTGDESSKTDEKEQARIDSTLEKLGELRKELAAINVEIEKGLSGAGVEIDKPASGKGGKTTEVKNGRSFLDNPFTASDLPENPVLRQIAEEELAQERLTNRMIEEFNKRAKANEQRVKDEDKASKAAKQIAEREAKAKVDSLQAVATAVYRLADLVGKSTAEGKALAIAASLINTYAAIAAILNQSARTPMGGIPGYAIAQAVAVGVVGLAAVKGIIDTPVPGGGGGGGSVAAFNPPQQAPAFNIVGASPENQIVNAINQDKNQLVRAYVVSSDVTTAQAMERNTIQNATLGG